MTGLLVPLGETLYKAAGSWTNPAAAPPSREFEPGTFWTSAWEHAWAYSLREGVDPAKPAGGPAIYMCLTHDDRVLDLRGRPDPRIAAMIEAKGDSFKGPCDYVLDHLDDFRDFDWVASRYRDYDRDPEPTRMPADWDEWVRVSDVPVRGLRVDLDQRALADAARQYRDIYHAATRAGRR